MSCFSKSFKFYVVFHPVKGISAIIKTFYVLDECMTQAASKGARETNSTEIKCCGPPLVELCRSLPICIPVCVYE